MRILSIPALVLVLVFCGDASTQSVAPGKSPVARRENANPLAVYTAQLRADDARLATRTSRAWGFVQLKVRAGGVIEWTLRVHNPAGESFSGGHVYVVRQADGTGLAALDLFRGRTFQAREFELSGNTRDSALAVALLANPGNYYVTLRTAALPEGAIRGELP